jgi:ABC-type nickel/cobalt efflux system permease component RcnA
MVIIGVVLVVIGGTNSCMGDCGPSSESSNDGTNPLRALGIAMIVVSSFLACCIGTYYYWKQIESERQKQLRLQRKEAAEKRRAAAAAAAATAAPATESVDSVPEQLLQVEPTEQQQQQQQQQQLQQLQCLEHTINIKTTVVLQQL